MAIATKGKSDRDYGQKLDITPISKEENSQPMKPDAPRMKTLTILANSLDLFELSERRNSVEGGCVNLTENLSDGEGPNTVITVLDSMHLLFY